MQVEGYINGTFNLVKNLPEEIAGLPKNVSPPFAPYSGMPVLHAISVACGPKYLLYF